MKIAIVYRCTICIVLLTVLTGRLYGQELIVPYVSTPQEVVEEMLDLANVGPADYVIDLGSGDGRIIIAAAHRGAVGHGVELNSTLIRESEENARDEGVDDRVMFLEEDIFETDFSRASVVTMYLLNSVNVQLRPSLLTELNPGSRVVSHSFHMGDWEPDKKRIINGRTVYYWVIPARTDGNWLWEADGEEFMMSVHQQYQEIEVELSAGRQPLTTEDATLNGDRITLVMVNPDNGKRYICNGQVDGKSIAGTVQIHGENSRHIENWTAARY